MQKNDDNNQNHICYVYLKDYVKKNEKKVSICIWLRVQQNVRLCFGSQGFDKYENLIVLNLYLVKAQCIVSILKYMWVVELIAAEN